MNCLYNFVYLLYVYYYENKINFNRMMLHNDPRPLPTQDPTYYVNTNMSVLLLCYILFSYVQISVNLDLSI